MAKRIVTPEEEELWQSVTSGDKKLHRKHKEVAPAREKTSVKRMVVKPHAPPAPKLQKPYEPALGSYKDIDKNTATKFRKGDFAIDATLDLHGMTRDKAHTALMRFIETQYSRGSRALLVITGKGTKASQGAETRGVLRDLLPGWLAAMDLSSAILALDVAKPKHGGQGAYYVLLRRKR